ncbi:hypothetical protein CRENBAI_002838 [Crenichthys baileyi]|uniref:Uncharacterized protein n=1 Tax=Crenichthys baileyi TaxID=28760 RepID=A0AAV9SJ98_9TELE
MRPPRHDLHFGPATKPTTLTVGTSQKKDQAADEEMITLWEYLRRAVEKSFGQAREKEEQRSPFWGSRLAMPPAGTGPRHHTPCAAEKGFIQARREEEQRSPFWGTRLAIPLPGTGATLHLRPPSINPIHSPAYSSLLVFGTCIRHRTLPLPGTGELHASTAVLKLFLSSKTTPPSRHCSSCCGDSDRRFHILPGGSDQHSFLLPGIFDFASWFPAFLQRSPTTVQTALVPVPDSTEGSADAPALVSAGVQLDAPALVSAGGQLEAPAPVSPLEVNQTPQYPLQCQLCYQFCHQLRPLLQPSLRVLQTLQLLSPLGFSKMLQHSSPLEVSRTPQHQSLLEVNQTSQSQLHYLLISHSSHQLNQDTSLDFYGASSQRFPVFQIHCQFCAPPQLLRAHLQLLWAHLQLFRTPAIPSAPLPRTQCPSWLPRLQCLSWLPFPEFQEGFKDEPPLINPPEPQPAARVPEPQHAAKPAEPLHAPGHQHAVKPPGPQPDTNTVLRLNSNPDFKQRYSKPSDPKVHEMTTDLLTNFKSPDSPPSDSPPSDSPPLDSRLPEFLLGPKPLRPSRGSATRRGRPPDRGSSTRRDRPPDRGSCTWCGQPLDRQLLRRRPPDCLLLRRRPPESLLLRRWPLDCLLLVFPLMVLAVLSPLAHSSLGGCFLMFLSSGYY